jgi:hypothetical protein
VLLVGLLAACGGSQAADLAEVRIDTLPGGVIRVTSEGPTAWGDSAAAVLVEKGRFHGTDGTTSELGEPSSIAVDGTGRIYVADSKPAAIKVFTPEGELVRVIGREGEGPSEFRYGFIAVRGEHLVLHDRVLSRTSVWDTAGTFLRSWHSSGAWGDIQIDRQDRIYISTTVPRKAGKPAQTPYVRWSLAGTVVDTLWIPNRESGKVWTVVMGKGGPVMTSGIPFLPLQTFALHPEGGFVYGWTGEYAIVRSATGKDSSLVFGRAWTRETISEERRKAEVEARIKELGTVKALGTQAMEEAMRSAFHYEDVPSTLPAYRDLRVDLSGRVWVRRHALSDVGSTYYDVFDSTGAYLGPVTVPFKVNPFGNQAWTVDGLVTVTEDAEGRPTVVRLKLNRPPRKP